MDEDYEDPEEYYEDLEERKWQEEIEKASDCHCGAYQIKAGNVRQVADCCCGVRPPERYFNYFKK